MAEEKKNTGEKIAGRGIGARIFLLALLVPIFGTIALLVVSYLYFGSSPT